MQAADLHRASWRLLLAWALLSLLGYVAGERLIAGLRPALAATLHQIAPAFSGPLELIDHRGERHLRYTAQTTRALSLGRQLVVPPGAALPASASIAHLLVPLVLFGAALVAWPVGHRAERWRRGLFSLPGMLVVLLSTAPAQLVGLIEMSLQAYAETHGTGRAPPLVLNWMLLLEGGGRWALPIVVAVLVVLAARAGRVHG